MFTIGNTTYILWPGIILLIILAIISIIIQQKNFQKKKKAFYEDKIDHQLISYFEKEKIKCNIKCNIYRLSRSQELSKYNEICFMLCCAYLDRYEITEFYKNINTIRLTEQNQEELQEYMNTLFLVLFSGSRSLSVVNAYNEYKETEKESHIILKNMTKMFKFSEFEKKYMILKTELNIIIQEQYLHSFIEQIKKNYDELNTSK